MTKQKLKERAASPADAWGIDSGYQDAFRRWHPVAKESIQAIRRAMLGNGSSQEDLPDAANGPLFIRAGERIALAGAATVRLEGGGSFDVEKQLPPDLPTGYHTIQTNASEAARRLIVSPRKCPSPPGTHTWGWSVQLYSARSARSWGMGDLTDLERIARWSAVDLDAGMLLVNPLSTASPIKPQQASPYFPSSRCFFNPLWIDVEAVPGAATAAAAPELAEGIRAGRELNNSRLIDRDRIFDLKMKALGRLWDDFGGDDTFTAFCAERGAELERYATFCTLAEQFNSGWHSWPEQYQHPDNPSVSDFAAHNRRRTDFHKWLQWLFDRQLARCSKHLAIMQDLPIGVDADGADAWAWQDVFATGASVGAPPDEFNTQGQNWGLPPFIPQRLRAAGYEPFIQTIRAAMRNSGGLRIDHVMGLFRLFWIPQGMSAKDGTYVRYPADELLAIVALESERAGAYVVGEDLGTVEDEVREKLADSNVLSYRLLWFEKDHPKTYPRSSLAAVTTHDLPTVAGLWTGSDLDRQRELKLNPNEESTVEIHHRLTRVAGLAPDSPVDEVVAGAYELLARAPSFVLTAALDDAAAVEERPNIPATLGDQNPNWSLALPCALEDLMDRPLPRRIASALQRNGKGVNS